MQKIILTGNLGTDSTVKKIITENRETSVINFSVASNIKRGENDITQWFNCSYFTEKTTLLDYLKKGTKVLIIGNFFVTEYLSNDNTKKMSIDVIASSLEILKFKDSDDATDGKNQSS